MDEDARTDLKHRKPSWDYRARTTCLVAILVSYFTPLPLYVLNGLRPLVWNEKVSILSQQVISEPFFPPPYTPPSRVSPVLLSPTPKP